MKLALACLLGILCTTAAQGQGTVWFNNNPASLISAHGVPIPPDSETFYFGLFIAPPGTTDSRQFTFTGNYATNASKFPGTVGRFIGGTQAVQGWLPGQPMAYLVRGWEAGAGHDWNPQWLDYTGRPFLYGESAVAHAHFAGGTTENGVYPAWVLYGGTGLQGGMGLETGFAFMLIPEPGTGLLMLLGGFAMLGRSLIRRRA